MMRKTGLFFLTLACSWLALFTPDWKHELLALTPPYYYGECSVMQQPPGCGTYCVCRPSLDGTYKGSAIKDQTGVQ